jgi:dTDP-glucose pyrophosphorylase
MNWINKNNLKCIVLCAGRGSRTKSSFTLKWNKLWDFGTLKFYSNLKQKPKTLFKILDKPMLYWITNFWKQYTNDFIFVVGYKKEKIIEYVKTLPINATFVEQKELKGIAHAIHQTKSHAGEIFIVTLGDCICKGKFNFPENMEQGVGVWKTGNINDIKRSFSVEHKDGIIYRVVEKPQNPPNNLCGMGFYFFNKKVFDYIEKAKPSPLRNEIEITDVMQDMINAGEKLHSIFFDGQYLNMTLPEDVERAEEILRE